MNIWIINHYAKPPSLAGGTRHHALAVELSRKGHAAYVIASSVDHMSNREEHLQEGELARLEVIESVPFLWIRTSPSKGYCSRLYNMTQFALRLAFGPHTQELPPPDVVIGSSLTLFAALAAYRLARKYRAPFVLEIRDVWPQTLIDFGMSRLNPGVIFFGWIERYLYRHADAIVTLLPGAISHIRERGAKDKEIVWIPNAVDFEVAPAPVKPAAIKPLKVMFAGALSQANCPDILLSAAEVLAQRGRSDIEICFLGDGPERSRLANLAEQKKLKNVMFLDPVPKRRVYDVLSQADVFVALLKDTVLYRFGMSLNKLYDYMAAARPVLFAARSFNDPISDSGCGLVVPPENPDALADAIEHLAGMSPDERWKMGLQGRLYVEKHHNFKTLAEKLEYVLVAVQPRRIDAAYKRNC